MLIFSSQLGEPLYGEQTPILSFDGSESQINILEGKDIFQAETYHFLNTVTNISYVQKAISREVPGEEEEWLLLILQNLVQTENSHYPFN